MPYDTIIRNGRWFDGTGAPSAIRNIGIRGGHIAAVSVTDLDEDGCPHVIDATGQWVLLAARRVLWIPPGCRPGAFAFRDNRIVIGSGSGRMTFLSFKAGDGRMV